MVRPKVLQKDMETTREHEGQHKVVLQEAQVVALDRIAAQYGVDWRADKEIQVVNVSAGVAVERLNCLAVFTQLRAEIVNQ